MLQKLSMGHGMCWEWTEGGINTSKSNHLWTCNLRNNLIKLGHDVLAGHFSIYSLLPLIDAVHPSPPLRSHPSRWFSASQLSFWFSSSGRGWEFSFPKVPRCCCYLLTMRSTVCTQKDLSCRNLQIHLSKWPLSPSQIPPVSSQPNFSEKLYKITLSAHLPTLPQTPWITVHSGSLHNQPVEAVRPTQPPASQPPQQTWHSPGTCGPH